MNPSSFTELSRFDVVFERLAAPVLPMFPARIFPSGFLPHEAARGRAGLAATRSAFNRVLFSYSRGRIACSVTYFPS